MRLPGTAHVSPDGHLVISGCDGLELARRFGTPLWVLDEDHLRENCRAFRRAFGRADLFPGGAEVVYASKALLALALCRIADQEGLALDVVSGGELYTALAAGFPPERIHFHGNHKTPRELAEALEAGVGRFMVDNLEELDTLNALARGQQPAEVILRLTPNVEPNTHDYIKTGQADSKFGFPIHTGQALDAVRRALASPHLTLRGLHCHIGSQIFETESHGLAAMALLDFAAEARGATGWEPAEINLGGGFAVRYNGHEQDPPSPDDYAVAISRAMMERAVEHGLAVPRLSIEPGRAIVAAAGWTLYTVGSVKDIPGTRTYVIVDGGMGDNPRPALYGARHEACLVHAADQTVDSLVTVAGRCCESGDILIRDLRLPRPAPGDILALSTTGAYNHAMSSNYNRLPRPAMVLVSGGGADLIVERETYADLVARERIPARLAADTPAQVAVGPGNARPCVVRTRPA